MQLATLALILAAGPALAQTSSNWQKVYGPPPPPAAPKAPSTPGTPAFKPFQGTSTYSSRGGIDAYPAPAKPKSGTTPGLFGSNGKPKF